MAATTTTRPMTADELAAMPDDGRRYELIEGVLHEVSPAGIEASAIAVFLGGRLADFGRRHRLGIATGADGGYRFARDPDTVFVPDVAFIRSEHLPASGQLAKLGQRPPDLAVEVVSPTDRPREVAEKVAIYLERGVALVWVVDPRTRTIAVHRNGRATRTLGLGDAADGEDVVPGFTLSLEEIFAVA